MNVGSLFSGAGLLDIGLHLAGWEHAWVCESDPWRRELLRVRFPGVPVFDDIRALQGQTAADTPCTTDGENARTACRGKGGERSSASGSSCRGLTTPVDLIAGGFPCRGISTAGKREGFEHAETVLWGEMRRVIGEVGSRYVLIENVSNILGMAAAPGEPAGSLWGTVLADLAALGFDVRWECIPAGAVGAPHLRDRLFAVAARRGVPAPAGSGAQSGDGEHAVASLATGAHGERDGGQRGVADGRTDVAGGRDGTASHADEAGRCERGRGVAGGTQQPAAERAGADAAHTARHGEGRSSAATGADGQRTGQSVDWGDYQPAITRWEAIHGEAPAPLVARVRGVDAGSAKVRRVQSGLDRSEMRAQRQRLSALGDGVCVYVAYIAGRAILHHAEYGTFG